MQPVRQQGLRSLRSKGQTVERHRETGRTAERDRQGCREGQAGLQQELSQSRQVVGHTSFIPHEQAWFIQQKLLTVLPVLLREQKVGKGTTALGLHLKPSVVLQNPLLGSAS